jgi:MFS family permease
MLVRMTTSAEAPTPTASAPKLLGRAHLPLVLGAVALVTLGAFENRAVGTALPTLVREFDALGSFGLANAAPAVSYLIALAVTGLWSDRRGPVPALRTGALLFAVAQLLVGTAASMPMVIAGRLLSGLAEGLIDIALMVLVARALPESLRPRMFSLFAAMWVLPSVFGPALTGLLTETVGWRWVFLGALGLLVPTWLVLGPAMRLPASRRTQDIGEGGEAWRVVVAWAVAAAGAIFALTLGGDHLEGHGATMPALMFGAGAVLLVSAWKLLPRGTFRAARGFPTVVSLRAATAAAFGGAGAYLPLLLTELHGFGPAAAGVSLTITGVMWASGSWLQGRDHKLSRATVLRAGLTAMTAGLALTTALAWTGLPAWVGLAGWAVAGVGMGLTSPSLAILTLDLSTQDNQGRNTSSGQMAASIAMATSFAVSGTLLAFAAPAPGRGVFGVILTAGAAMALLGLLASGRISPRRAG